MNPPKKTKATHNDKDRHSGPTPGPWKATHIGESGFRRGIVVDKKNCGQICEVLDTGNGIANARLIAKAPELLGAAKKAIIDMTAMTAESNFKLKTQYLDTIEVLRQAIAEAERG